MENMMTWLKQAELQKASTVVIRPDSPILMRVESAWRRWPGQIDSVKARREMFALLSETEKDQLFDQKRVSAEKIIDGIRFQMNLDLDEAGVHGHFELNKAMQAPEIPKALVEIAARADGLILISGGVRSGKTTFVSQLLEEVQMKSARRCLVFSDQPSAYKGRELIVRPWADVPAVSDISTLEEVIVLDSKDTSACEKALAWSEMGFLVILTMPIRNLQQGIERFVDSAGSQRDQIWRRLSLNLAASIGLHLLPGTERSRIAAQEILIGSSEIRSLMTNEGIKGLFRKMNDSKDRLTLRNLNQSLFHLVVTRQLDLRQALERSDRPDDLDQKLKDAGI